MNTLPRAITAQIHPDETSYQRLRVHWSALMHSTRKHELRAMHHLLYTILLGKDWRRAFTPVSNPRKLANGAYSDWALRRAIRGLHCEEWEDALLAPFDGLVTAEMLRQVRLMTPNILFYHYQPEHFANGFPFDAYSVPAPVAQDGEKNA